MRRNRQSRTGWGLAAAGGVLFIGFLVREAAGEPAAALLAIAVVFVILGLPAIVRGKGRGETTEEEKAADPAKTSPPSARI